MESIHNPHFLSDQERLKFRTLTLLLQHTNVDDEPASRGDLQRRSTELRSKYDLIHYNLYAYSRLLLQRDESIAVHITKDLQHLKVAKSTSARFTPQQTKDESDTFVNHCFVVDEYLKDIHNSPEYCSGIRIFRTSSHNDPFNQISGTGTTPFPRYWCASEHCQRCGLLQELRVHVIRSSYARILQRLDFGKASNGRNILWAFTRPLGEIVNIPGALEAYKPAIHNIHKLYEFFKAYGGMLRQWNRERNSVVPQDSGESRLYGLMFHFALRYVLLDLDTGLHQLESTLESPRKDTIDCSVTIAQVSRALEALHMFRLDHYYELRAEYSWLQTIYSLQQTTSFPRQDPTSLYQVPKMASPPSSGLGHHLYAEARALDTRGARPTLYQHPWNLAAEAYLDLILDHEFSLDTLAAPDPEPSPNRKCPITLPQVLRTLRIEPIVYTPFPSLAGLHLPPLDIISTLPTHLHAPLIARLADDDAALPLAAADPADFPGASSCHAEMQFAALHQLARLLDSDATAAAPLPRGGFLGPLRVLASTQPPCAMCAMALTELEFSSDGGGRAGRDRHWRVPLEGSAQYLACDVPAWMPRRVGERLIRRAEEELLERAERIYEGESEGEEESDGDVETEGEEEEGVVGGLDSVVEIIFEDDGEESGHGSGDLAEDESEDDSSSEADDDDPNEEDL